MWVLCCSCVVMVAVLFIKVVSVQETNCETITSLIPRPTVALFFKAHFGSAYFSAN